MESNKEISEQFLAKIKEAEKILLFPHIQVDGDAAGSSIALCRAFRAMGKEAWVFLEEALPAYLRFLDDGFCTTEMPFPENFDLSLAVDCGDSGRLGRRLSFFEQGCVRACMDHHVSNSNFTEFGYIDPESASCAELVYQVLCRLPAEISAPIAECIYTGIVTDTGNFQYSNVKASTHRIAAELYDRGLQHERAIIEIFQNVRRQKLELKIAVLETMRFFADGQGVISFVSQALLKKIGAEANEIDGIVETMRSIAGVEYAVVLKEQETGVYKATMRSKTKGNVAEIATKFGGGGHIRAAGCTFECSQEEAAALVCGAIEEQRRTL